MKPVLFEESRNLCRLQPTATPPPRHIPLNVGTGGIVATPPMV